VLASAKGGALSETLPVDDSGYYHSRHTQVTFTGGCRGVSQVKVTLTPDSESETTETTNCQGTLFSWTKTFSTQKRYQVEFEALDESAQIIASFSKISRYLIYDATAPAAPTFLTPTAGISYTVNNGQTQFTITGQVGLDTKTLTLNNQTNVPLTANGDGIHQDYSVNVNVPVGQSVPFVFAGKDIALNPSASTMTITSNFALVIPIAMLSAGGKDNPGGLSIFSTIAIDGGQSEHSTVQLLSGVAAIVGSAP
jgi:hypothetical protein